MKYFAAMITSVPDMLERRQPYRQEHLERLRRLHDEGKLVMAGAWGDTVDGALIIYQGESREEVEKMITDDVYYTAGLWPEYRVREWNVAIK